MKLTKCPRCEINYITDGEQYCKICRLEMKGEPVRDEIEMCTMCGEHPAMPGKDVCMCTMCGEHPAMPGKDVCLFCMKEMNGVENSQEDDEGIVVTEDAAMSIDPISGMDEIIPETDADQDGPMSLEALGEEEEDDDDPDDDDLDDGMGAQPKRRK